MARRSGTLRNLYADNAHHRRPQPLIITDEQTETQDVWII
jgi:hypothetical protein